jgi:tetratricopeptide (TPR) repeat protein
VKDQKGMSSTYNNLARAFEIKRDTDMAMIYYKKSLQISESLNNVSGIAAAYNNIGALCNQEGDAKRALGYYTKSLAIMEKINDKRGVAVTLNNIAGIYQDQKNYDLALQNATKGWQVSKEIGFPVNIRNSSKKLYSIYKAMGNYKPALENFELYIRMRDSMENETTRKASIKSQLKYEYEKQAAADSVAHVKETEIKNAELAKQHAEIRAKKNQQYGLFAGLSLVIIFAGFMYNRFKVTQKQKLIIEEQKMRVEEQKSIVEEKQKEILDSIHYARRIQKAQLPNEKFIIKSIERLRS